MTPDYTHNGCKMCDAMEKIPSPSMTPRDKLAEWWRTKAEEEIDMVADKAVVYGANDLYEIGFAMYMRMGKEEGRDFTKQMAIQAGIYFYLLGKIARLGTAVEQCKLTIADTPLDIGIYSRMLQRTAEAGEWPGV